MQKSTKNLLGLSGLALVGAMTVAALAIPVPDANATGGASASGEVQIQVKVYSGNPESVINAPADSSITTDAATEVKHTYDDADFVDYTLKWGDGSVGEDTSASGTTKIGTFIPSYAPASGDNNFPLNLLAYGGYGKYVLTATVNSNGQKISDSTSFRYAPVAVSYVGTDENGDPIFKIVYNAQTTKVDFDLLGEDGKTVLDHVITMPIENPGTAGEFEITVPAANYGLKSSNYSASATAYGPIANAEVDADSVVVVNDAAGTSSITADYTYDSNTAEIYFHIVDKNGKLIVVPASRVVVSNPGTAGSGTVTLDLSDFDLSDYDLSEVKVLALAYPILGSTKNIGVLDSDTGPVQLSIKYTQPDSPDVPNTGIFGGVINLAKADYVITGVIGFSIVTLFALVYLRKHDRRSSRRRR